MRATILCSPNFGYKHYLKVLGDRPVEGLDLSAVRLIFNGAEPISVELCNEFLTRLAPAKLARNAMFPVYGLAEASLAVTLSASSARRMRTITLNRHQLECRRAGRAGREDRHGCRRADVRGQGDSLLPGAIADG